MEITEDRIYAGISLYSRKLLYFYDWLLLGACCRLLWNCPSRHMLELYNEYISANHLDIGVGSGYFMDRCRFPSSRPRLALMDLSHHSLRFAGKRLSRYSPEIYNRNVLDRFHLDVPPFDSVGLMNVLHCLPGNMETKTVVFRNISEVLNPGGVLFGSTILYRGIRCNWMVTRTLEIVNYKRFMTNLEDTVEDLKEGLERHFAESSIEIIGCEALFHARK